MTDYEYDEIMEAIENLATMVQREFLVMQSEFLAVHEKIDSLRAEVGKDIGSLRGEIREMRDEMKMGFAAINSIVFNHEFRLDRLEKKSDIS